jgi:Spy/CpxP family protein refolding chaperone
MKKHILTVAAFALLSIPTYTIAQDKPAGEKPAGDKPAPPAGERPGRGQGGRGNFSPEERIKRMTEQLALTQDQQDKIKAIYAKQAEAMKALQEKGRDNWTDEDRTKMRESFTKQQEEVAALLTPEQKEKMKTLRGPGGPGGRRPGGPGGDAKPGEGKPEEKK